MPKVTHDTTVRDAKIAKLLAKGKTYREVGQEVGLGKSTIAVISKRDDVKAQIEQEQKRLVSLVPTAVNNYKRWIEQGQVTNDKDTRDIAFKASTKVLESTGILNGTPSTLVNILYNDNKTIISPVIMDLLKDFSGRLHDFKDDIIEGELVDGE